MRRAWARPDALGDAVPEKVARSVCLDGSRGCLIVWSAHLRRLAPRRPRHGAGLTKTTAFQGGRTVTGAHAAGECRGGPRLPCPRQVMVRQRHGEKGVFRA